MTASATALQYLERPGGRRVAVHNLTPAPVSAAAPVVLLCHAAPGSGLFDPDPPATAAAGVRLLAVDRPGYGGSDRIDEESGAWASVGSAADDAAAALDALGITRAGVAGWSAGGRVAMALAARRPDLVGRVVALGTPAPDEEVPWVPEEHRAALEAMRALPPAQVHAALAEAFGPMLEGGDDALLEMVGATDADRPALESPGARDRLVAMLRTATANGAWGLAADIAGYVLQPWGFEPAEVGTEVLLAYGASDPVAGTEHGRWWQRHLPSARLEVAPGAGHLLVIPLWQRMLAHLSPAA